MDAVLYGLLCLIWGSTWAAIKFALDGVPPFFGASMTGVGIAIVTAGVAIAIAPSAKVT